MYATSVIFIYTHCNTSNKNFILDIGMEKHERYINFNLKVGVDKKFIAMEGICITHSCIPPL